MTNIDVRYGAEHDIDWQTQPLTHERPVLTWGWHPEYGNGWTLSYLEDDSETAGVDDHFIPGDLLDVEEAVSAAERWLALRD